MAHAKGKDAKEVGEKVAELFLKKSKQSLRGSAGEKISFDKLISEVIKEDKPLIQYVSDDSRDLSTNPAVKRVKVIRPTDDTCG